MKLSERKRGREEERVGDIYIYILEREREREREREERERDWRMDVCEEGGEGEGGGGGGLLHAMNRSADVPTMHSVRTLSVCRQTTAQLLVPRRC